MFQFKQEFLRALSRRFWGTVFTLIIAIAVCVQLGREIFPFINDHRDTISAYLGDKLGVDISVRSVTAEWEGFRPNIQLNDVTVKALDGTSIFTTQTANAELSLIDSFFKWKLSWRRLLFNDFDVHLSQNEQGKWRIPGLEFKRKRTDNFVIDDLLDVFLFGRRVEIKQATIMLNFHDGQQIDLLFPELAIENDKLFHRVVTSFDVDGESQALSLIVEGHGDPRNIDNFIANGYLSLKNFPMEKVVAAFGKQFRLGAMGNSLSDEKTEPGNALQPNSHSTLFASDIAWGEAHRLNLDFWFHGSPTRGVKFKGVFDAGGHPAELSKGAIRSDLVGSWTPEKEWEVLLNSLDLRWQNASMSPMKLKLFGDKDHLFNIAIERIQLSELTEAALSLDLKHEKLVKAISALSPSGILHDTHVEVVGKDEGFFKLKTTVRDVAVGAYMGAPELAGVNGYLEASVLSGFIDVNADQGLKLFLPRVYNKAIEFETAEGRIGWEIDAKNKRAYLTSGLLSVTGNDEYQNGYGYLNLNLPFSRSVGEAEMTLAIGVKESHTKYHKKYVPYIIPADLKNWLDDSVGDGLLSDVAFLYHGSVEKTPAVSPTIQLFSHARNMSLVFDSAWPELTDISGTLRVDNEAVSVAIDKGEIYSNTINDTHIELVRLTPELQALNIFTKMSGASQSALGLLLNSPVKDILGDNFDNWQLKGRTEAYGEFVVPLSEDDTLMSQSINARLKNTQIYMPDIDLQFTKLNGDFQYTTKKGLSSKSVTGLVWGKEINAHIESVAIDGKVKATDASDKNINIHFTGKADVDDVRRWTSRPEMYFMNGVASYNGVLTVPAEGSEDYKLGVLVKSKMQGIEMDFPAPMTKLKDQEREIQLDVKVFEEYEHYTFDYDSKIKMEMLDYDNDEDNARSAYRMEMGGAKAPLEAGLFNVAGHIPGLDVEEWNDVLDRYDIFIERMKQDSTSYEESTIPVRMNLLFDVCSMGEFIAENLEVTGLGTEEKWLFNLYSEAVSGDVTVFSADIPSQVRLAYLRFPKADDAVETDQTESAFADVDLSDLTPFDFSSENLFYGDENFGSWSFKVRPMEAGLVLFDMRAKVRGMQIGQQNEGGGAEFVWTQKAGPVDEKTGEKIILSNRSQFSGSVYAEDLGVILENWGQEKLLESERAAIDVEAVWPGALDEISLKNLKGLVSIDVEDGSFIRGAKVGENPLLRLLALFNFDTLVRRLRLDFSDLAKKGYPFDKVYGDLDFQDGTILLATPLIVESSSSKMQLTGTIDIAREKVDAELVATLPVASSLATTATALIVGLPAAVGVYVIGKMFKEQVDKASSIKYKISGNWDSLKYKVRKVSDVESESKKTQPQSKSIRAPATSKHKTRRQQEGDYKIKGKKHDGENIFDEAN